MIQPEITVKNLLGEFGAVLSDIYSINETRQIFNMLCNEYFGWNNPEVQLSMDRHLTEDVALQFRIAMAELLTGKPIQYVLGKAWFNHLVMMVNEHVLIPRPETEELCLMMQADPLIKQLQAPLILDICTGSGCIAIYLKKRFPAAVVGGIDNSRDALKVASVNANNNQCLIGFYQSDILNENGWSNFGEFDVIVSNPPYVLQQERHAMQRNVTEFEPENALYVPDNTPLLFYKAITKFAAQHLHPSGSLWFEINERFGDDVSALVSSNGFSDIKVLRDIYGRDRFIRAALQPT